MRARVPVHKGNFLLQGVYVYNSSADQLAVAGLACMEYGCQSWGLEGVGMVRSILGLRMNKILAYSNHCRYGLLGPKINGEKIK